MKHISLLDKDADPFEERPPYEFDHDVEVLGGRFCFSSNAQALLELVRCAYADLPVHDLGGTPPCFDIRLRLVAATASVREPPPLQLGSGGGMLCGIMDAQTFALICPAQRSAFISISDQMLDHAYHARYELIEFAVYTLAARAQALVSLHGACVGRNGRGVLLIGESGAGKSTLALHCLCRGMQLLSEDSVFAGPDLRATGVGTFLHLRVEDPLRVRDHRIAALRTAAATIRRRSGTLKHALDLRGAREVIADAPFTIAAIAFLSKAEPASEFDLVRSLSASAACERLRATQAYAATQPTWQEFIERASGIPAFELGRAHHPDAAARVIEKLLDESSA